MKAKLNEIIKGLKLGRDNEKEIKRILNRPEVKAVLDADEIERIHQRRILAAELAEIPGKVNAAETALAADAKKVVERYISLERELAEIAPKYKEMTSRLPYAGFEHTRRAMDIERELWETADSRIGDYGIQLGRLEGAVQMKFESWLEHTGERNWLGEPVMVRASNGKIIDAALQEIGKAVSRLRAMRLEPLAFDEVSNELSALTERLRKPLTEIKLTPPRINADGEVKEPLPHGVEETVE
ncbi:hypothetical protein [Methylomonas koyamae]|uniref:Uncharacterized protein n=1 Tax=Methylomonas koyamae TaxID=702114 RepID=A0A291IDR7_9GAMM|nr:hypothetical protein [Methylomonas koyamae]ATG88330.1 hypothetical protein MKLM6_0041 [Methylomonas koyamae]OAI25539.1 hypothetical protein A1356_00805 [Methylomonas koyamae]